MRDRPVEIVQSGIPKLLRAAMLFALLLVSLLLVLTPAQAQRSATNTQYTPADDSRQQAETKPDSEESKPQVAAAQQVADPLADEAAQIVDSADSDVIVNRVIVSDVDCTVDDGATILVEDRDGTRIRLTDDTGTSVGNVNITSSGDRIIAQGSRNGNLGSIDTISGGRDPDFNAGSGTVIGSTGIMCDREKDDGENGGDVQTASDLLALNCEDLLLREQNNVAGQYGDPFANARVEAQIAECLEQEVIDDEDADEIVNIPDDDLPDTGGLPLLGLAVLGLASVAAGVSVIRGAGRGE